MRYARMSTPTRTGLAPVASTVRSCGKLGFEPHRLPEGRVGVDSLMKSTYSVKLGWSRDLGCRAVILSAQGMYIEAPASIAREVAEDLRKAADKLDAEAKG